MIESGRPQLFAPDKGFTSGGNPVDLTVTPSSGSNIETIDTMRARISGVISPSLQNRMVENLGEDEFTGQVIAIAATAAAFHNGETAVPSAFDYVAENVRLSPARKNSLGVHHLRGILSSTLIPARERQAQGSLSEVGVQMKVARELNTLRTFMGSDDESMVALIESLDEVERALFYESISTAQKCLLRYPDADVCTEEQMRQYLHDAVYGKHGLQDDDEGGQQEAFSRIEMFDRVEQLIGVMSDRSEAKTIDVSKVMSKILRPPYNQTTLQKIVLVASYTGHLDILEDLFLQCPDTAHYAQVCRQVLDGERKLKVPEWMKEDNAYPRRNQE